MISFTQSARRQIRGRSARLAILGSFAVAGLTGCSGGGGTVNVALQEFAVVPAVASVEHGKVTFAATNTGPDDPHELVVFKTDLGVRDLPASAEGKVDEAGAGLTFVGEIEEFDPGKTGSATFDLAAGRYVLVCNIVQDEPDGTKESHYLKGMAIEFTVK
jgi:uncharacterized cupredoxin-like copper-binding protein